MNRIHIYWYYKIYNRRLMIIHNSKVKIFIKKAKTTFYYATINSRVLPNLQSPSPQLLLMAHPFCSSWHRNCSLWLTPTAPHDTPTAPHGSTLRLLMAHPYCAPQVSPLLCSSWLPNPAAHTNQHNLVPLSLPACSQSPHLMIDTSSPFIHSSELVG